MISDEMTALINEIKKDHTLKDVIATSGLPYDTIRRICRGKSTMYSLETLADTLGKKVTLVDKDDA